MCDRSTNFENEREDQIGDQVLYRRLRFLMVSVLFIFGFIKTFFSTEVKYSILHYWYLRRQLYTCWDKGLWKDNL